MSEEKNFLKKQQDDFWKQYCKDGEGFIWAGSRSNYIIGVDYGYPVTPEEAIKKK